MQGAAHRKKDGDNQKSFFNCSPIFQLKEFIDYFRGQDIEN
jgi:hypothetical protein